MNALFTLAHKVALPFLRISMGVVLFWIGALKFADPSPVVGLLQASLPFLASNVLVYLLGAAEIALAALLVAGVAVRYVGIGLMGLFGGTLLIFLLAPKVTYGGAGFPFLALAGEFLLKDLDLFAVAVNLIAMDSAGTAAREKVQVVPHAKAA
jgi:putative oxidoreductase